MENLDHLVSELGTRPVVRRVGRLIGVSGGLVRIRGLSDAAAVGEVVTFDGQSGQRLGEIVGVGDAEVAAIVEGGASGLRADTRVFLDGPAALWPSDAWIGRVIDPFGAPMDGRPLAKGAERRAVAAAPPPPMARRGLGRRMETGLRLFNTLLPIVRGQRIGLFAGAGVGKTTLLAQLARGIEAEVVVIALVGERGREVRDFLSRALGPAGLSRSVVVAATSDRSHLARRRCLPAAMAVAEHFRDAGRHVLLVADSVTRFVEAHREVALAAGEPPALDGFPPSIVPAVTGLCERAGPGMAGQGDITAIFSVLMAGSDTEGPVADTLRGVLDGHVVLDRRIAERGRFPAVDVLRSVSRALPDAASEEENALIAEVRADLSLHEASEVMVRAGLHEPGADPTVDRALERWPRLDAFFGETEPAGTGQSFLRLAECLRSAALPS